MDVDHEALAQFVVLPDGRGYLVESTLPALVSTETYQLWGVVGGQTLSLGLIGAIPELGDVHAGRFTWSHEPGRHGRAGRWFDHAERPDGDHGDGLNRSSRLDRRSCQRARPLPARYRRVDPSSPGIVFECEAAAVPFG